MFLFMGPPACGHPPCKQNPATEKNACLRGCLRHVPIPPSSPSSLAMVVSASLDWLVQQLQQGRNGRMNMSWTDGGINIQLRLSQECKRPQRSHDDVASLLRSVQHLAPCDISIDHGHCD